MDGIIRVVVAIIPLEDDTIVSVPRLITPVPSVDLPPNLPESRYAVFGDYRMARPTEPPSVHEPAIAAQNTVVPRYPAGEVPH